MADYLSASDLFLFPSTTDTFGMSVLEAQACHLPALVTREGGPKEIICHDKTGYIIPVLKAENWREKIEEIYLMKKENTEQFKELKIACRERALSTSGWDKFFAAFISEE